MHASFEKAKATVNFAKSITIPKASDQLQIVTDGAVKDPGVGATLYVTHWKAATPHVKRTFMNSENTHGRNLFQTKL